MKKKLLNFFIFISSVHLTINAQVPSYVPTNGLESWWSFTGNANDDSNNNNDGTVYGANLTNDRFGNLNSAYAFDGIDDFISINDNSTLKPTNQITISAWVNIDENQTGNFRRIISKQYEDLQNFATYQLITGTNNSTFKGTAGLALRTGPGNSQIQTNIYSWSGDNGVSLLNQWQHILGVYNGSQLKFYQNGILVSTVNFSGNLFYDTQNLLVGKGKEGETLPGTEIFFKGKIDDIGIWNRALTEQEIDNLYNNSLSTSTFINSTINIFPNPTSSVISVFNKNFNLDDYTFHIFNNLGQLITEGRLLNDLTNIQLDKFISQSGIYYIQIKDSENNIMSTQKIVFQN